MRKLFLLTNKALIAAKKADQLFGGSARVFIGELSFCKMKFYQKTRWGVHWICLQKLVPQLRILSRYFWYEGERPKGSSLLDPNTYLPLCLHKSTHRLIIKSECENNRQHLEWKNVDSSFISTLQTFVKR